MRGVARAVGSTATAPRLSAPARHRGRRRHDGNARRRPNQRRAHVAAARAERRTALARLVLERNDNARDPRAIALHDALFDLEPTQRDSFDFRLYDGVGGVADTPIPQYFPYIYRQYPRAKVILTERDPTAWVTSRQKHHPNAFLPFAVLSHALSDIRSDQRAVSRGYKGKRVHAPDPNNMMGSSTAFVLHNTMVRARARPQRCASVFADAPLTSSFSPLVLYDNS